MSLLLAKAERFITGPVGAETWPSSCAAGSLSTSMEPEPPPKDDKDDKDDTDVDMLMHYTAAGEPRQTDSQDHSGNLHGRETHGETKPGGAESHGLV